MPAREDLVLAAAADSGPTARGDPPGEGAPAHGCVGMASDRKRIERIDRIIRGRPPAAPPSSDASGGPGVLRAGGAGVLRAGGADRLHRPGAACLESDRSGHALGTPLPSIGVGAGRGVARPVHPRWQLDCGVCADTRERRR